MKILIGCEESQEVCTAFRNIDHEAYSNDIIECSGNYPQYHLLMDVKKAIFFKKWDIIILHPPCTALCVSGNSTYAKGKKGYLKRLEAMEWTKDLWLKAVSVCNKVCMENPVGVLGRVKELPKPQYIQPWQFGHGETKKTGLWLYGLKPLEPTNIVSGREHRIHNLWMSKDRSKIRSKTYRGIAEAMATQWG